MVMHSLVSWPVTNPNGPHPRLKQHVGMDIVPAWRENLHYPGYKSQLDLAVITTPDAVSSGAPKLGGAGRSHRAPQR